MCNNDVLTCTETRGGMVGCHRRCKGEQFRVDKAADAATEGKSSAGVYCAVGRQTQLHSVFHE